MPTTRYGLGTAVVEGKIYAIGGGLNDNTPSSTVEMYDPATDTWTKKADMPTARFVNISTSEVNGIIYAIGGGNANRLLETVEAYDPATDTWTRKADMPTARGNMSTCVVNGKIYAMGGTLPGFATPLSTVEAFDPELPQSVTPAGKLPTQWGEVKVNQ